METATWERAHAVDVAPTHQTVLTYADTTTRAIPDKDHNVWAVVAFCQLTRFYVRLILPPTTRAAAHAEMCRVLTEQRLTASEITNLAPFFDAVGIKKDASLPVGMAFGYNQAFQQRPSTVDGVEIYEMTAANACEQIRSTPVVAYLGPLVKAEDRARLDQLRFMDVFARVYSQV